MHAVASPVMASVDATPISARERAAQQQLQGFMIQHPAFLRHVLRVLCSGQRVVELLLLPPPFHGHVRQFLAEVRGEPTDRACVYTSVQERSGAKAFCPRLR